MKMMLIWCILCSFFALAFGIDVGFSYGTSCFPDGGTAEMTATYTGSGTVTAVQWYYSGQISQNLLVLASNCQAVPPIDTGYPPEDRMKFECNMATKVYKLRLLRLEAGDFDKSWGVTFSLLAGGSPVVVQEQIKQCARNNSTNITTTSLPSTTVTDGQDNTDIKIGASVGGGIFIVIVICVIVCCYIRHKKNKSKAELQTRKMTDIKHNSDLK